MQISQSVTRALGTMTLQAKRNSPHIFFGAGVVGLGVSTVLACRATLKLERTLDEVKERVEKARVAEHITESERPRVMAVVYVKGAVKIGALYAPSVVLGAASVAALTGSHVQLARRNSALSATLALVTQAYDDYRERVREEVGEEKELDIYRAVTTQEVTVDGKKQLVKVADPNRHSVYARCFDETSWQWQKNAELNRIFLQHQQNYLNHQLNARGYVFLNEVYEALGMDHSSSGAVVGWLAKGNGDGYIDFKMFEVDNADFINGRERSIWLDFNVDGQIYTEIDSLGRHR